MGDIVIIIKDVLKRTGKMMLTSHSSDCEILAAVLLGFRQFLICSLCLFGYTGLGNR